MNIELKNDSIINAVFNKIDNNKTCRDIASFTINVSSSKLKKIILKQHEKGIKKYGQSIDDCPFDKYNWLDMMYEELADFLIYEEKLNRQIKQKVNDIKRTNKE